MSAPASRQQPQTAYAGVLSCSIFYQVVKLRLDIKSRLDAMYLYPIVNPQAPGYVLPQDSENEFLTLPRPDCAELLLGDN